MTALSFRAVPILPTGRSQRGLPLGVGHARLGANDDYAGPTEAKASRDATLRCIRARSQVRLATSSQ